MAEIARVDVGFKLLRLLRKEVRVTTVAIETPLLTVVSDEDGSNLARATAPRKPKPREPPKREKPTDRHGRDGWVIRLDRFDLTGGDIRTAVAVGSDRVRKLHVAALNVFASVRYAIGNGSLDLGLRVAGRSALEPTGPLALALELAAHGDAYRVDADGKLLDGTLAAHGNVDTRHLGAADVLVALAIPRRELAGHTWGPVRIDARAQPSAAPTLDVLVKIPGVELTAKDQGREAVAVAGRLAVADLSLTGKAIGAISGSEMGPLAGRGQISFAVENADFQAKGGFEMLRFDTTTLEGIAVSARLHEQDVTAALQVSKPARVELALAGRFSDERRVFDLARLMLGYPGTNWALERPARLRSDDSELSLSNFRLVSKQQTLAIEARRRGEDVDAHLALTALELGQLPTSLIDPKLRLDGVLNLDVKAQQQRVEATMGVQTSFLAATAAAKLSMEPLGPGAPMDVALDIKHLDIGKLMRAAGRPSPADGRANLKLRLDGSTDDPNLVLTVEAFDLELERGPAESVDVGKARVRVTYADRVGRAELDFASARGGKLVIDASTNLDLSYPNPGTKRRIVAAKLPIRGRLVARNLDVGWVALLNPRVETVAGKLTADARLGGSVGNPEVIGDVRWKNGAAVATQPPPAGRRPPASARPSSTR